MDIENLQRIDRTVSIAGIDVQTNVVPKDIVGVKHGTPRVATTMFAGELFDHFDSGAFNLFQTLDFAGKEDETAGVVRRLVDGNSDIGVFRATEEPPKALLQESPDLATFSLLNPDGTTPVDPITVVTRVTPENEPEVERLLETKKRYNENPESSDVDVDPCEINMDLVRQDCKFKSETGALCTIGVVMKEGRAYCPLKPYRQLTLRSTFASTEAPIEMANEASLLE